MAGVNAWVLTLKGRLHAAVGELEMVHIIPYSPKLFVVPASPDYSHHVLIWEDEVLPVMDLRTYLLGAGGGRDVAVTGIENLVGVVAFQAHPGEAPRYGGLLLDDVPARVRVTDDDACALPVAPAAWAPIAVSCFEHEDHGPVPVLDLRRLFSRPVAGHGGDGQDTAAHCDTANA